MNFIHSFIEKEIDSEDQIGENHQRERDVSRRYLKAHISFVKSLRNENRKFDFPQQRTSSSLSLLSPKARESLNALFSLRV